MEHSHRLDELFELQLSRKASTAEKEELMQLLADEANEEQAGRLFAEVWRRFNPSKPVFNSRQSAGMLDTALQRETATEGKTIRLFRWRKAFAVAAAVGTIVFGVWFFNYQKSNDKEGTASYIKNDVAPGKNGATITLASGKVIELSDAKTGVVVGKDLKYSDGTDLSSSGHDLEIDSKTIQTLTASTAKAQTYQFTLSDGTRVWLNSDSKISFPAQFSGKERKILLEGEGYFEVAKDKAHPFIVATDKQEVEVLGTHFNVNSYADEPVVATTLIEGSVRVSGDGLQKILKPGEQALNNGTAIKVGKADLETAMDWKNNEFYFEKMDFRVAMRKIARWYNVEVIYSGSVPENLEAGGWIPRNSNLSDVIKSIESSGLAHFKIEGRTLYVSK